MVHMDWQRNSIKILSVLLAIILWLYVSNEQNPAMEKNINVNLEHAGLAQNYIITGGMPEDVRVKVHGNKTQLGNLASGDFRALVNIPEGETGEISLPVQVHAPPGIRVVQVYPEEVAITVDVLMEKVIPVAVSLRGKPAPGYTAHTPVCQPGTVVARGPGQVVSGINQATVILDMQSATSDIELTLPVNAGSSDVTLIPSMARVIVPIVSATVSKTVPVQPQVTGAPAAGFTVARVATEPAAVQISGPADIIDAVTEVKTWPLDITGINEKLMKNMDLVPVPGVTNIQPYQVQLQVELNKVAPQQPEPSPDDDGAAAPQEP